MLDYTLPLTSEESAFAEKHHDVLLRYLRFHKLPVDEFYDIAVFGYLRAVRKYLARPELQQYQFSTIARRAMSCDIHHSKEYWNRAKRKGEVCLFDGVRGVYNVLSALSLLTAVLMLYRMFSKNLPKRREENARFLNWWLPKKNRLAASRQRRLDKEHKYFSCKNCKAICRVPAGKGKIEITCPRCGQKISGKS